MKDEQALLSQDISACQCSSCISDSYNYKIFLKGLNCSNCAAKIEKDIMKQEYITSAQINLINQTLSVISSQPKDYETIFEMAKNIIHKYEPDVSVYKELREGEKTHNDNSFLINVKGLNCSNCAAKIENDLKNMNDIQSAEINLINQKLKIILKQNADFHKIYDVVVETVNKYEPDVEVSLDCGDKCCGHDHEHNHDHDEDENFKLRFIKYGIGFIIFLGANLLDLQPMIKTILIIAAYLIFGFDVLLRAVKNILKGKIFDENFLMAISTLGAIAIGELSEAVFVMFFYQVGETFQDIAVGKSRKSIKDLMDIKPEFANKKTNSGIEKVAPETVKKGDLIIVKPGEKVPLDGTIIEGAAQLDTVALTGESVPRQCQVGDYALNGSINIDGLITIKVEKEFSESTVMKILEMVENASGKKSKTEQFITKFARIYTPVVVLLAVLLAFIPPLVLAEDFKIWIGRALIFLVVSCPCALVLSVPLGFFSGIGAASKNGVLVKGSNYIQGLSEIDTIVFDKTGTVTQGVFEVTQFDIDQSFNKDEIVSYIFTCEKMSNHPLAKSISAYCSHKNNIISYKIDDYKEIRGMGISAYINGKNILIGNAKLMDSNSVNYIPYSGMGSVVYAAVDGKFAAKIIVSDKIKEDTPEAIKKFKALGIKDIIMLTGDNDSEAAKVCENIGINRFYANLLPQNKVEKIEELYLEKPQRKIAFIGDGINDAPVLSRVDVGIAMGGVGSDAAIEAADVVIMNDSLVKVADGMIIAENTKKIVKQNIVFALLVKCVVLILGALGMASMWAAVFADVGVAFICILNSMRRKF